MNETPDSAVSRERKDKGFTLIELLIVIVILGILATVTVFAVRGISDRGSTSACQADKNTLATAVESYFAQNSTTTIPNGTDDPATTTITENTPMYKLVQAGLLRSASSKYNVGADGTLTAISPCT